MCDIKEVAGSGKPTNTEAAMEHFQPFSAHCFIQFFVFNFVCMAFYIILYMYYIIDSKIKRIKKQKRPIHQFIGKGEFIC